jgi:hypothetical protein
VEEPAHYHGSERLYYPGNPDVPLFPGAGLPDHLGTFLTPERDHPSFKVHNRVNSGKYG